MLQSCRTFRIFVSSTFSDLKAERNALQEKVFPRLCDLAAEHGCRFQAIDLRWGVSEEASLDQQTMNICLGEIAHCQNTSPRPNFIVLLGDRYGWCPLPSEIPASEFEQITGNITDHGERCLVESWYCRDDNAVPPTYCLQARTDEFIESGIWKSTERTIHIILERVANQINLSPEALVKYSTSATEQEIVAGALSVKEAPSHVLCFFRSINDLPKEFNALNFLDCVNSRLKMEYPNGLDQSCQKLVTSMLNLSPDSTAKNFADQIMQGLLKISKTADEEDVLNIIWRELIDTTAYDFQNLNEENWIVDEEARHKQIGLKKLLSGYVPQNIFSYKASWEGNDISKGHINKLCGDVYGSLSTIMLEEIKKPHEITAMEEKAVHIRPQKELDIEGLAHHKFAEDRLHFFVGRTEILAKIEDYLSNNIRRSLAIVGAGGSGKSALMARAIQQTQEWHPKAEIVYRFIGATPGSSDGRSLLDSLCHEISRHYGADVMDVPIDYRELVIELGKRFQLANADRPLILFLDSLDQLSTSLDARNLIWLPNDLPENVFVITSTRPEDTLKVIKLKQFEELALSGLSHQEGIDLLTQWLTSTHRTLQPAQQMEVLDKFEESECNPLYLKLAYEEARLWSSGSGLPPEHLAPGVTGIMETNMINRLTRGSSHGEVMVSRTLGYLAASRHGLAEDEIIDLLSRDIDVFRWFIENSHYLPADLIQSVIDYRQNHSFGEQERESQSEIAALEWLNEIRNLPEKECDYLTEVLSKANGPRLPVVLWSRLSFDLSPYMTEKFVDGSPLLTFYHRELGEVSAKIFLGGGKEQPYHTRLGDYFRFKADPTTDRSWTGKYPHGLSELPYHLTKAGRFEDVFQTLTDFKFLEHKSAEVGVLERKDEKGGIVKFYSGVLQLQNDYEYALESMPVEEGSRTDEDRWPLIITAVDSGHGLSVYCPVCNKTSPINNETLDTIIVCPQEGCNTRLKINPFVIQRS